MLRVLVIEDSATVSYKLRRELEAAGFAVEVAPRFRHAMELLVAGEFGLVLLDMTLPDGDGLQPLKKIRARRPDLPVILLTGMENESLALDALRHGALDFWSKRGLTREDADGISLVETITQALERHSLPTEATGRESEITVLFSDLRGFTALSERLSHGDSASLIRDLMDRLTSHIVGNMGMIVDFAGDGILAMWNAPNPQPDHVERAARATLAMQSEMPRLNRKWQKIIGGTLRLGVGLNTGPAHVGNTGSVKQPKYGPLGLTVNCGSRVQDTCKKLGVPMVVTTAVRERLPAEWALRRLCRARLPGIAVAVELHELVADRAPSAEWSARRDAYERALSAYEAGQFGLAVELVRPLAEADPSSPDKPSVELLRRASEAAAAPPEKLAAEKFDPVYDLSVK